MKASELIFIGIKASVVALSRATGEQVWVAHLKGSGFVNVVVERGRILASCSGEIFCLDAATGNVLWHNQLKGFGVGLATIASEEQGRDRQTAVLAEKQRSEQEAASAAAVVAAT
jgi:outer membrane protein assembly factor BamB